MTKQEFIKDLVENYEDFTTSDLQGVVEARCIITGENEDEILEEVYKNVENKQRSW